ncbi:MAG: hypothetical protein CVU39_24620 [Chloroflexi bacterium HGW-Chloroflexi-10]|nr:MAG: hypothetical protein CVU39_24620 [Chloroflexi bacterium HGW-Chloroflexi-10]
MPAIQLDRLNQQILSILQPQFGPQAFVESLKSLMDAHTNRAYRPGFEVEQNLSIESYHLAPIIVQQLNVQLIRFTQNNPDLALSYVQFLWNEPFLELKTLAATILGVLPQEKSTDVLRIISALGLETNEKMLLQLLFLQGTHQIRKKNPKEWLSILKEWLDSGNPGRTNTALQALQILAEDNQFENLPTVFSMLTQAFLNPLEATTNSLVGLVQKLAERSPIETAYHLRNIYLNSSTEKINRLIRRCIPFLPEEQQFSLRQVMR